jgi:hypothetical protein
VVVDVEDSRFALARKLEAADLKFSDRPLAHAGTLSYLFRAWPRQTCPTQVLLSTLAIRSPL